MKRGKKLPDLNEFKELTLSINSIGGTVLIGFFSFINIYQKTTDTSYNIPQVSLIFFGIGLFLFLITYYFVYKSFNQKLKLNSIDNLKNAFWSAILSLVFLLISIAILIF